MKKKLAVLLALMLQLLAFSAAIADYDPIIVRVGQYGYPRSQVLQALELGEAYLRLTGNELTAGDLTELKSSVINSFIVQGVLENKIHELGLDVLTEEDLQAIVRSTMAKYAEYAAEYRKAVIAQYGCDDALANRAVPVLMELDGITPERLQEQAEAQYLRDRLTAYVCRDVPRLTDSEVLAWYRQNYVAPSRERYANDQTAFEQEVVLGGGTSFYVPADYRFVQNIVLTPTEAQLDQAYVLRRRLAAAEQEVVRLDNALYGYQLLGEDDTQARADLEAGQAEVAAIRAELSGLYTQMAEPFAEQIRQLQDRLAAGEDFMSLRSEFDTNPDPQEQGYLVCSDSVAWEDVFRDAAMSLQQPGNWTGPILTGGGVQFLLYVSDVPQGEYPIELAGAEQIAAAAQADADNTLLMSYADLWRKTYEVEIHTELLIWH